MRCFESLAVDFKIIYYLMSNLRNVFLPVRLHKHLQSNVCTSAHITKQVSEITYNTSWYATHNVVRKIRRNKCWCEMNLISVGVNYHDTIIKIYELNEKKNRMSWWIGMTNVPKNAAISYYLCLSFVRRAHAWNCWFIHSFFSIENKNTLGWASITANRQAGKQALLVSSSVVSHWVQEICSSRMQ